MSTGLVSGVYLSVYTVRSILAVNFGALLAVYNLQTVQDSDAHTMIK